MLGVIEQVYDFDLGSRPWLEGLARELNAVLSSGPSIAIEYDCALPIASWFVDWIAPDIRPSDEGWLRFLLEQPEYRGIASACLCSTDRLPVTARLSELLGVSLSASPFGRFGARFGLSDVLLANANDGTQRGVVLGLSGCAAGEGDIARVARVLPHVSAALRIRRGVAASSRTSLPGAPHDAEAVLDVDGIVRDGEVSASERELLRHAVLTRDRLRCERKGSDPDEVLIAWTALIEGRWSLVDVFERSGKRWVVAVPNLPDVRDPRALPPLARAVFGLLARGRANKSIAFELGLAEGTVAGYVRDIRARLGEETIRAAQSGDRARVTRLSLGAAELVAIVCESRADLRPARALSAAEQEVVGLVLSGYSNEAVARERGTSPRTVANQLASAYVKLGVGSRRELRASVASASPPGEDPDGKARSAGPGLVQSIRR